MFIINFVFVALFALLAEYLRCNVFKFSNLFQQEKQAPAKVVPKATPVSVPAPTEIKSQKVKELYEMHCALKSTKESYKA